MTNEEALEERRAYEAEQERVERVLRTVRFGMTVQEFLESDVGQYLQARAIVDRNAALEELANTQPHQWELIAAIQQRIRVIDQWQHWIGDAINEGESARKAYVDMDIAN